MHDSTGAVTGIIINENVVTIDTSTHQIIFTRTRQYPTGHLLADTSVAGQVGPVRFHATSLPLTYEVKVAFNKYSVDAQALRRGIRTSRTNTFASGYFDDNIVEELFGFLPIEHGRKYHLEAYRFESKDGSNPYDIEYVFDDFLQTSASGVVACKVLHYMNGYSSGYIWVDKKTSLFQKEIIYAGKSIDVVEVI